jgi:hypothetical protein
VSDAIATNCRNSSWYLPAVGLPRSGGGEFFLGLLVGCRPDRAGVFIEVPPSDPRRPQAVFRHACAMGLEGIVAKRRDKPYRSGRTPD